MKRPQPRTALPPGLPGVFLGLAVLILTLLPSGGTAHAAPPARILEYLYVEANEGDSSGGHAALNFGRETFHFQHENPGIIRIHRVESDVFDHIYADLGNRPIHGSGIAVSDETWGILRDTLQELLLIQDAQLAIRRDLRRNLAFLELLQQEAGSRTPPLLSVRGAGYFLPDQPAASSGDAGSAPPTPPSPELLELRERIEKSHGEGFLVQRIARLESRIRDLPPESGGTPPPLSRESLPPSFPTVAARHDDLLLALFALKILQAAPPLRPGAFRAPAGDEFRLGDRETATLERLARRQREQLLTLIGSARPDWGFPFLVGMARLCALSASLRSGRLVFLDVFPDERRVPEREASPAQDIRLPQDQLAALAAERRRLFRLRRMEFFGSETPREAEYALLERTGNLLLETELAQATGRAPRRSPEASFPSREALRSDAPFPRVDADVLNRAIQAARDAVEEYDRALTGLYPYNLVRRNCVTELFAAINAALARHASLRAEPLSPAANGRDAAREESRRRLGGFIAPDEGLTFIPFVSAGRVDSSYAVTDRRVRPSHRRRQLAEMGKREAPLPLFLRECNTLTSTTYRFTPDDSSFLFFTDDAPLLRPLFGAFNLATGLGESLLGLATLPVRGPARLLSGVRGMLFSLPELFFVSIRKGTMGYVEAVKQDSRL